MYAIPFEFLSKQYVSAAQTKTVQLALLTDVILSHSNFVPSSKLLIGIVNTFSLTPLDICYAVSRGFNLRTVFYREKGKIPCGGRVFHLSTQILFPCLHILFPELKKKKERNTFGFHVCSVEFCYYF